jgi:hypothetical protein
MADVPQSLDVSQQNLAHVLANDCTDLDCELHHPEVGWEERTVNRTDLAFFLAGAFRMLHYQEQGLTINSLIADTLEGDQA